MCTSLNPKVCVNPKFLQRIGRRDERAVGEAACLPYLKLVHVEMPVRDSFVFTEIPHVSIRVGFRSHRHNCLEMQPPQKPVVLQSWIRPSAVNNRKKVKNCPCQTLKFSRQDEELLQNKNIIASKRMNRALNHCKMKNNYRTKNCCHRIGRPEHGLLHNCVSERRNELRQHRHDCRLCLPASLCYTGCPFPFFDPCLPIISSISVEGNPNSNSSKDTAGK